MLVLGSSSNERKSFRDKTNIGSPKANGGCLSPTSKIHGALRWRHNECDEVSNHQPLDCLLNRLFRRRSRKTSKLSVTGLYEGNSPVTGEFPAKRTSNAEYIAIWWRHHGVWDDSAGPPPNHIVGTSVGFSVPEHQKSTQHIYIYRERERELYIYI